MPLWHILGQPALGGGREAHNINRTFVAQHGNLNCPYALWPLETTEQANCFNSMGAFHNEKPLMAQDGHLAPSTSNMLEIFILNIFF